MSMTRAYFDSYKFQDSVTFNSLTRNELKILVAAGEGSTLEFKRKASFPDKVVREMIAFANTAGGTLLIGIGDDGSIPGLKYPEEDSFMIQQALKKVKPLISITETFIPVGQNRTVLHYAIPDSPDKPHYAETPDLLRDYYVRVADKSIKASRELREIIKRKKRCRDIRFRYGDHEKFLMQYFEQHASITLDEFIHASGLKRFYASNKLILLVLANVLRIVPNDKGDEFMLAYKKY